MESASSLVVPRLRLSRFSQQPRTETTSPIAGPSRHSPEAHYHESEEEDAESTPRLSQSAMNIESSPRTSPIIPTDTPAGRLRALLARVPDSATPRPSTSQLPPRLSPSEPDSDFDPPPGSPDAPSLARESLKELFSRALREPGNTPQKARARRNSIDTSIVEASPRIERVQEERAKNKGKRRSMSDEETEHLSRTSDQSVSSFRATSAATFDALRQRLGLSTSTMMPPTPTDPMVVDMSMPPANSSEDTILQGLNKLPQHEDSPMRTVQLSAHLQAQSNLLEQDSEMQKALRGMDSYEGDSLPNGRPLSFPPARPNISHGHPGSPSRPLSWSSHSKSHSTHNLPPVRHVSDDHSTSSRTSSSLSGPDYQERHEDPQHERERRWNHPVPSAPKSPGLLTPSTSRLSRKDSTASLRDTDNGRSSRASSVMSQSEYREREKELEHERNKERELQWNKPKLSHSSSRLSLNTQLDRSRTNSQPTRPDSAMSLSSPARHTLHRHHSSNSLSSSSRAGSPASSVSSRSVDKDPEIVHVRERNWNSPHPKWEKAPTPQRAASPMHQSTPAQSSSHLRRANSAPKIPAASSHHAAHSAAEKSASPPRIAASAKGKTVPRSLSPFIRASVQDKPPAPRAPSPPPPTSEDSHNHGESADGGFKSRFGWSFPQNRAPLPPLELDEDSPVKPHPPRPSSALSGSSFSSHIPVPSPRKSNNIATSTPRSASERKKGHRRSLTEFSEAVGAIPRIVEFHPDDDDDDAATDPTIDDIADSIGFESDEEPPATSTPPSKYLSLPSASSERQTTTPPGSPTKSTPNGDAERLQKALARPVSPPSPPSHSTNPSSFMSALQTPPRRAQLNSSKMEFETPPPPKNMPELPGPPSSEEDDIDSQEHTPVALIANMTTMKTPRPPGAWADTPAPQHAAHDPFLRAQSTPPDAPDSSSSILATPATKPRSNTLPRSGSAPPQTPALPGAWMVTPATARRKSILKVRFDVASEAASSDAGDRTAEVHKTAPSDGPSSDVRQNGVAKPASGVKPEPNGTAAPLPVQNGAADQPATPGRVPRTRRSPKSPSIRVVDAFGRETSPEGSREEPAQQEVTADLPPNAWAGSQLPSVRASAPDTSRSKSIIKMVDAMGREIVEPFEEPSSDFEVPLTHNEALARVRQLTAHLAEDLSEVDRSCGDLVVADDQKRLAALDDASKAARNARNKISRSIQLVTNAESDLRKKYGPLRESMRRSSFLLQPMSAIERRLSWNMLTSWTFWFMLIFIQFAIWFIMHRISIIRAKAMFLTTYYDPYYPDLYLYVNNPDTTYNSIPLPSSWSIYHLSDIIERVGWTGLAGSVWTDTMHAISTWQNRQWVAWAADNQETIPWPPT